MKDISSYLKYKSEPMIQKLIYLFLLDNDYSSYRRTKKACRLETPDIMYANVKRLAEMGLIHPHPFLTLEAPTKPDERKARGLSLVIADRSYKALYWALSQHTKDYLQLKDKGEDYYLSRLKQMASNERESLLYWERISKWLD